MDDNLQNIDKYYREKLVGYSAQKNTRVWNKLRWVLFWDRYKFWVLSALVLLFMLSGYSFYNGLYDSSSPIQITQSERTVNAINAVEEETGYNENDLTEKKSVKSPSSIENLPSDKNDVTENSTAIEPREKTVEEIKPLIIEKEISKIDNHSRGLNYQNSIFGRFSGHDIAKNENNDIIEFPNVEFSKTGKKGMYSVSVFAGPALSDFSLSGANEEYINYRNDNESSHISWSAGARFSYHFKNILITTGLDYSVYNQKRSYSHTSQIYSPEDSYYEYDTTWTWIFDPPNIAIPVVSGIDSTWVEVYNTKTVEDNGINRLSYLEIPLLLGYQMHYKRYSFEISAGMSFGFLVVNNVVVPLSQNDQSFKVVDDFQKFNINILLQGNVYYHLNRRTSVYISPYLKKGLNSVYSDSYPVNQRLTAYGINFGVSLRF